MTPRQAARSSSEEEEVHPLLITLLNEIQEKAASNVVITAHRGGKSVDFYVARFEDKPLQVVEWLMHHYNKKIFKRASKNPESLRHPGWVGGDLVIRIHEKDEGRTPENRHPYPYITLECR